MRIEVQFSLRWEFLAFDPTLSGGKSRTLSKYPGYLQSRQKSVMKKIASVFSISIF